MNSFEISYSPVGEIIFTDYNFENLNGVKQIILARRPILVDEVFLNFNVMKPITPKKNNKLLKVKYFKDANKRMRYENEKEETDDDNLSEDESEIFVERETFVLDKEYNFQIEEFYKVSDNFTLITNVTTVSKSGNDWTVFLTFDQANRGVVVKTQDGYFLKPTEKSWEFSKVYHYRDGFSGVIFNNFKFTPNKNNQDIFICTFDNNELISEYTYTSFKKFFIEVTYNYLNRVKDLEYKEIAVKTFPKVISNIYPTISIPSTLIFKKLSLKNNEEIFDIPFGFIPGMVLNNLVNLNVDFKEVVDEYQKLFAGKNISVSIRFDNEFNVIHKISRHFSLDVALTIIPSLIPGDRFVIKNLNDVQTLVVVNKGIPLLVDRLYRTNLVLEYGYN